MLLTANAVRVPPGSYAVESRKGNMTIFCVTLTVSGDAQLPT